MSTHRTAQIFVKNQTDGTAMVQLSHRNSSHGQQDGSWTAQPGETVGPLTVSFLTGAGSAWIQDFWWVQLTVTNGTAPGIYASSGSLTSDWKECQLQSKDADQQIIFTVSTSEFKTNLPSGSCSNSMKLIGPYRPITRVFVLMLENHSFDNIFAGSGIPGIVAATRQNTNLHEGISYGVSFGAPSNMPTDPGHEFPDVVEQLCGPGATYVPGVYPPINNSGFAANYATTESEGPKPPAEKIGAIMQCFDTPRQLPVISQLAREFAICDHWFSSLPGPTWPNRFFVHGASSSGLDHSPSTATMAKWLTVDGFTYPNGSIYDSLDKANLKWRLYIDDSAPVLGQVPQVASLKGISTVNVHGLSGFRDELSGPYPYCYTFIEPNYGDFISGTYAGGSSQHPMDGVAGGERLIKTVYEALRNSPHWQSSLLIITYDEHGGFYDSVEPGAAVPPGDGSMKYNEHGFDFTRYGVRVPAVVISPLIPKATVDHTVYDHASVLATVERNFGLSALTNRDRQANDLRHLLSLNSPRTDCPTTLSPPATPTNLNARAMISASSPAAESPGEPIPESSNLNGFLAIALKTRLELSRGDPIAEARARAEFANVRTTAQARDYVEAVMQDANSRATA